MSTAAALRSNWRKVSSTDNLQAFNAGDGPQAVGCRATRRSMLIGCGMITMAVLLLAAELTLLVLKLLPLASVKPVLALQEDQYYIHLVPLMIPMVLVAVTVNWFSLKLFKHNS